MIEGFLNIFRPQQAAQSSRTTPHSETSTTPPADNSQSVLIMPSRRKPTNKLFVFFTRLFRCVATFFKGLWNKLFPVKQPEPKQPEPTKQEREKRKEQEKKDQALFLMEKVLETESSSSTSSAPAQNEPLEEKRSQEPTVIFFNVKSEFLKNKIFFEFEIGERYGNGRCCLVDKNNESYWLLEYFSFKSFTVDEKKAVARRIKELLVPTATQKIQFASRLSDFDPAIFQD